MMDKLEDLTKQLQSLGDDLVSLDSTLKLLTQELKELIESFKSDIKRRCRLEEAANEDENLVDRLIEDLSTLRVKVDILWQEWRKREGVA